MAKDYSQPNSELSKIADAAMSLIATMVEQQGGEPEEIFVAITVKGMMPDACTCGFGLEDPVELIAWLLTHAQMVAAGIGVPLGLVPMPVMGEG